MHHFLFVNIILIRHLKSLKQHSFRYFVPGFSLFAVNLHSVLIHNNFDRKTKKKNNLLALLKQKKNLAQK